MTAKPIGVLLVDDQPVLRAGLATILSTDPGIEVVGEASNGHEALEQVAALDPDVVCMDVQMPAMDGIAATKALVEQHCRAAILMLTTFNRDDFVLEALKAGASGFLLKTAGPEQLVHAIEVVAAGDSLLAPEVTGRVVQQVVHHSTAPAVSAQTAVASLAVPLTPREHEILAMLVTGQSNANIAQTLYVGAATVKTHVSNILAKLGVKDRVHAVIWAYEHGYIQRNTIEQ